MMWETAVESVGQCLLHNCAICYDFTDAYCIKNAEGFWDEYIHEQAYNALIGVVNFAWLLFTRDCLAFATEPIFASLANLLGKHDNMPSPLPHDFKVDLLIFFLAFLSLQCCGYI